jgi:hypothetical protein
MLTLTFGSKAMERDFEEQFALLNKKIEEQFRFTRNVIVLCTLTILGIIVFTVTTTLEALPPLVISHCMVNLDQIVTEWKACEAYQIRRNKQYAVPAPTTAPAVIQTPAPEAK